MQVEVIEADNLGGEKVERDCNRLGWMAIVGVLVETIMEAT